MPIPVYWHADDPTILYIDLTGRWTWAEAANAVARVNQMAATVTHSVYMIVDSHNVNWLLPDYGENVLRLGGQLPKNTGLVLHIGNEFLEQVFKAFSEVYGEVSWQARLVRSLEEALALIALHRAGKYWHSAPTNPDAN